MGENERLRLACDFRDADLELALSTAERPDLLRTLVDTSRHAFGFFPDHYPHTINYPWITERLESLPPGARVLDIGAGVSPLPLWLANRGCFVETVDSHRIVRTLPASDDWNGWGYFDYQQLSEKINSHQCAIQEFTPFAKFDAIYSASVLAHLTRQARDKTLRNCREWLRPGGSLLLAIDLIPSSDFLWNRVEDRWVEPLLNHGTIRDIVQQLHSLDFEINQSQLVRMVRKSRTDLFLVGGTAV
jgi:2-polyprenyl-3-methyl-5-hydroxy-6-metoxy-1,4-benzoquinol methylase